MVSFFERGRPEHRESGFRRSEVRIIAAAYPPCSGVVKGRGTLCFGTAVGGLRPWWGRVHHCREDMEGARCPPHPSAGAASFPSRGSDSFAKSLPLAGKAAEFQEKEHLF